MAQLPCTSVADGGNKSSYAQAQAIDQTQMTITEVMAVTDIRSSTFRPMDRGVTRKGFESDVFGLSMTVLIRLYHRFSPAGRGFPFAGKDMWGSLVSGGSRVSRSLDGGGISCKPMAHEAHTSLVLQSRGNRLLSVALDRGCGPGPGYPAHGCPPV